jgi:hypothetical protein
VTIDDTFGQRAVGDWYNTPVRLRSSVLLAATLLLAACGVTDGEGDALTPTTASTTSSTSTPTTQAGGEEDPSTTTTGSIPELTEQDLAEALPQESDLPEGFFEIDVSDLGPDDSFGSGDEELFEEPDIEAGPECETMVDRIDTLSLLDAPTFNAFGNVDEVELDTTLSLVSPSRKAAFEELDRMGTCQSYRIVYGEGFAETYTLTSRTAELGEVSFVIEVAVTPEVPAGEDPGPPYGFTTVSVLHGEVVFTVDLYDGYSSKDTIARDPALAVTVAELVDKQVGELQAD